MAECAETFDKPHPSRSPQCYFVYGQTDRQTDNIYSMTTFLKLNPFCVSQVRSTANDAMVHCLAQKDTDLAEERDPEQFGRRWREDLLFQDDLFSHCYNLKRMFVSLFLPVVEVSNKLNSAVFEMVLSLVRSKSRTTCVTWRSVMLHIAGVKRCRFVFSFEKLRQTVHLVFL